MKPEDYQELRRLYHELADLSPSERAEQLDARNVSKELRLAIESFFREQEATIFKEGHLGKVGQELVESKLDSSADEEMPERIGGFEIRGTLGRGGMGVVYHGVQRNPRRDVAIKVLNSSVASEQERRRFEYEAEVLARLDHPYIAKIFGAGLDEAGGDRPFISIELIDGRDLQTYCDEHKLNDRQRLELFAKVCEGVEHAHQNGVVHRDLKPHNILVSSDGRPRILDFGLARPNRQADHTDASTPGRTEEGFMIGSASWMSPEQARGEVHSVDIRSDVYALGVILFRLLAGRMPYEVRFLPLWEAARLISEEEPQRLGQVRPELRGDLESICMMALEKEKNRRYSSAGALGRDVGRFLRHQPVDARTWSPSYQLSKFARRHRPACIAVVVTLVALISGTVMASVGLLRAETQIEKTIQAKQRADHEAAKATEASAIADRRARQVLGLSDHRRIRELEDEAEGLWPSRPDKIEDLKAWLKRTEGLRGRLNEHKASQTDFGHEIAPSSFDSSLDLTRLEVDWWRDAQGQLIADLEAFLEEDNGTLSDVHRRLEVAQTIREETIDNYEDDWEFAIEEIFEHPAYDGLELSPQLGLIPLEPDPESGLWEFFLWESGEIPERDEESDRWIVEGETGVILVLVPGGTFNMGATQNRAGPNYDPLAAPYEGPVHEVSLGPFFLSKYEMTQGQWERLMKKNPSYYFGEIEEPGSYPIDFISWNDAKAALHRLGMVLPTEAQWEYACRAGTETPWASGETSQSLQEYANVAGTEYGKSTVGQAEVESWNDGHPGYAPVGSFRANDFGLHDMHGNLWEWCRDSFAFYRNDILDAQDGLRLDDPEEQTRILRGGNFDEKSINSRSATRNRELPIGRYSNVGVRPSMKITWQD